jgi:hypothetical protein
MGFRIYCPWCKSKIAPPFWNQYGKAWCSPQCASDAKSEHDRSINKIKRFFKKFIK